MTKSLVYGAVSPHTNFTFNLVQEGKLMLELKTEILLDATPNKVWQAIIDFKYYPLWNSFIKNLAGNLIVSEKLIIQIAPPGKKEMTFFPVLMTANENRELRWVGKFLFPFLFRGEHYFILEPINDNQTKLIHGEVFSGLFVPLMEKDYRKPTRTRKVLKINFCL